MDSVYSLHYVYRCTLEKYIVCVYYIWYCLRFGLIFFLCKICISLLLQNVGLRKGLRICKDEYVCMYKDNKYGFKGYGNIVKSFMKLGVDMPKNETRNLETNVLFTALPKCKLLFVVFSPNMTWSCITSISFSWYPFKNSIYALWNLSFISIFFLHRSAASWAAS